MISDSTPSAGDITVGETLLLLDGPFAALAQGITNGQYAFWLGSGISLSRLAGLRGVVERVLSFLQEHIDPDDAECRYRRALDEALDLAKLSPEQRASIDCRRSVDEWPMHEVILTGLTNSYAELLDVRVAGEAPDYLLWDAVDVSATYASNTDPDVEHICLAVLALEGVLPDVASANWDGLIESAAGRLASSDTQTLQVYVRAADFRKPSARTRLLKFHGCAVLAAQDPEHYRHLLIARQSQITWWPHNPEFAAMQDQLTILASTRPTLMIGLSAQDTNIQYIFAHAAERMPWTWPCDPPAHVFAEDRLDVKQTNILKVVYGSAYDLYGDDILQGAHLRVYAKVLLTSLVLYVLCAKLRAFVLTVDAPKMSPGDRSQIADGILQMRDLIATFASADLLGFITELTRAHGRAVSLFQEGSEPIETDAAYRPLSAVTPHQIPNDPSLSTGGVRELATALGLIGIAQANGDLVISTSGTSQGGKGVFKVTSGLRETAVFFAANGRASVHLYASGIVDRSRSDVLVIHSTERPTPRRRSPRRSLGRIGRARQRDVVMAELLMAASGVADLQQRFREASSL